MLTGAVFEDMHVASEEDRKMLEAFLLRSCSRGLISGALPRPRKDVTVLMYFFWGTLVANDRWPYFEGALFETWRHCGALETVIVSNAAHPCLTAFAAKYSNVQIQVEERLVPGDINTMSIDCNSRLFNRFETPWVLIVQDDGFPLRQGLDRFVDAGYDFIGAPYCRPGPFRSFLTRILNFCPSNGGFSLRTRRICEATSEEWNRKYANEPFVVQTMSEDLFFTDTLPRRNRQFHLRFRRASSAFSEKFSYEGANPLHTRIMPFGFHSPFGFAEIVRRFGLCHER